MNRCLICVVCLILCYLTSAPAQGQIVRIGSAGGVRVRAPFVAVDVLPYGGGTRVRAPFTSVRTGAYGYGYAPSYRRPYTYRADPYYGQPIGYPQPYIAEPLYSVPVYAAPIPVQPNPVQPNTVQPNPVQPIEAPSGPEYRSALRGGPPANEVPNPSSESHSVSTNSLVDRLIGSAQQLHSSLAARPDDADIWRDYLQPERIIALVKPDAQTGAVATAELALLLKNYQGVTANPSLSSIGSAPGFRATFDLLRQYVGATDQVGSHLFPATDQQPAQLEPKLAKPVAPSRDSSDGKLESNPGDRSEDSQSVLLAPEVD